jgi:hypothetical protein
VNVLTASLIAIIAGLLMVTGYLAIELRRLNGKLAPLREAHGRLRKAPPLQRHHGRHQSRAAVTAPPALLAPEQVTAHAGAMFAASEPYLPPVPQGGHPYRPMSVRADRPVTPVRTGGHAPWTGSQPAIDEAALAEMDRLRYVRAQLDECGDGATADDLRRVLDSLRRPVYGETSVADVLEGERLAAVMQQ